MKKFLLAVLAVSVAAIAADVVKAPAVDTAKKVEAKKDTVKAAAKVEAKKDTAAKAAPVKK